MNMENQILTGIIAVLGATIGAYLGSYFSKKGELLATKKDFEEIKHQLEETTRITHIIQSEISKDMWIDQKRWELRRDLYLSLLENLNEAKFTIRELYMTEFGEIWEKTELWEKAEDKKEFVKEIMERNKKANSKIKELINLSGILFLSDKAMKVLDTYLNAEKTRMEILRKRRKNGDISAEYEDTYYDYIDNEAKAVSDAYDEIVSTAKADLQINKK